MIVPCRRCAVPHHPQPARHAEVQDQRAGAAIDQQVLAAPREAPNGSAGEELRQAPRHRLAHPPVANHGGPDALADQQRLQPAPRGFDFG